jgi:hypothetical protein
MSAGHMQRYREKESTEACERDGGGLIHGTSFCHLGINDI